MGVDVCGGYFCWFVCCLLYVYCLKVYNSACARYLDDFVYYYTASLGWLLLFDLIEFACDLL